MVQQPMNTQTLSDTANALMVPDKGLLAMDESNPTCNKRFAKLGIPQNEEARRVWRELLITTPDLNQCISGVILYDETMRQQQGGTFLVKAITNAELFPASKWIPGQRRWQVIRGKK